MDLTLGPEQEMLVRAARGFLAHACSLADVRALERDPRGFDRGFWRRMAALGWQGMELSGTYGGSEMSFLETALLLEEMGRVLLPSPFLATVVLAAPLVRELGSDEQRRRWLPAVVGGECVATLALVEPGWRDPFGTPGLRARDGGRLTGTKRFVPFAPEADLLLVAVAGPSLVALERGEPGVACTRLPTLGGDPVYDVELSQARGEPLGAPAAAGPALARALDRAAIGTLAYMVGAAERVLEMTVEHAKTRVQFGRPIGSFQAVAHRCVDMRAELDALRYLVYQAAWTLAAGGGTALEIAAAQAYGTEALRRLFMHAHQVHGAIGFSTEHDLHLFTRRAKAAELAWGPPAAQHERVAQAMGLGGKA
jgi:alkylation response protein AidB-like acyl-CoA dehydrogenase